MSRQMIIYPSGPMTNLPKFNKPAFWRAERFLKQIYPNCIVLNPAVFPDGLPYEAYLEFCKPMVKCSTHLYMLYGWKNSNGANIEFGWGQDWNKEFLYEEILTHQYQHIHEPSVLSAPVFV